MSAVEPSDIQPVHFPIHCPLRGFHRIRRQPQARCKVIGRTCRNVSQRFVPGNIAAAGDHFVQRTVTAHTDDTVDLLIHMLLYETACIPGFPGKTDNGLVTVIGKRQDNVA